MEKQIAAPTGKDGSAELVCQAALPGHGVGVRFQNGYAVEQQGNCITDRTAIT